MIGALAASAALAATASGAVTTYAQLQVNLDGPVMVIAVRDSPKLAAGGRMLTVDCVEGCSAPVRFEEEQGDTPLGLFQLSDAGDLVFSTWAGGSAYRVRAYRLSATGVSKVLEASTLGAPEFTTAADGAIRVSTTERNANQSFQATPRRVTWTWRAGKFVRN